MQTSWELLKGSAVDSVLQTSPVYPCTRQGPPKAVWDHTILATPEKPFYISCALALGDHHHHEMMKVYFQVGSKTRSTTLSVGPVRTLFPNSVPAGFPVPWECSTLPPKSPFWSGNKCVCLFDIASQRLGTNLHSPWMTLRSYNWPMFTCHLYLV